MIQYDKLGRAYTDNKVEASEYMVEDRQINFHAIKNGYKPQKKYIKMYTEVSKTTYVLPVSQHKVQSDYRISDVINFTDKFTLYDYQQNVIDYIKRIKDAGKKSALIVSSMGTGKSVMISGLIGLFRLRTVIVVPTLIIAKGIYDTVSESCHCSIVKSSTKSIENFDVIIMTTQSFNVIYEKLNGSYDILIMDEGHHASAKRIEQINKRRGRFVLALTATPERKEYGISGFEMLFGNVIDTGVTALPVKVVRYDYKYNYSTKEFVDAGEGLSPDSPEVYRRLYCRNNDRIGKLGDIIKKFRGRGFKRFIVFVDRIEHASKVKEELDTDLQKVIMTGKEKKAEIVDMLRGMDEYIIIGMNQCTGEGFDVKPLEVGILFTSTSRNNTVMQTAGRMVRNDGVKTFGVYVDFVDHIQVEGSKEKILGRYERNKVYKKNNRQVLSYNYA